MKLGVIACVLLSFGLGGAAVQADWPSWRGPDRNGITSAEGFNPAFAEGGAQVLWRKDIGVGYTPVTVADGKAYTAGWKDGNTTFYCYDAATGEEVWTSIFPMEKYDLMNQGGPSGAVVVDGERVYHQARDGRLFCYNAQTGEVVYEKDLTQVFGVEVPRWGFSGTPVIIGDTLYLDIGRIIALNKTTGEEVWKTDDFGPAYSTPVPFTHNGTDYLAAFPRNGLYIVNRGDGAVVAHHPWEFRQGVNAATPVLLGDGRIFISSGYNMGGAMLRFTGDKLEVIWENRVMRNQTPTCLYVDGHLYGFDDRLFKCVNAETGEEVWSERGLGQGTVIAAGDTMIVLTEDGELVTAPISPVGFNPIARARVINEQRVWISPTLADGRVYCRGSEGELVCVNAATP